MTNLALVAVQAPSLYSLTDDLAAHLDTIEMTAEDSPERKECEAAIALYFAQLPAKVDSVAWRVHHFEMQIDLAKLEVKRLQARQKAFERALTRLETYTVRALEGLPEPKRGPRKLEGETNTLQLRPSERAVILDEKTVPVEYKAAAVEMPALAWEALAQLDPTICQKLTKQDLHVRLEDVKKALKEGIAVPGADLISLNNLVCK